MHILKVQFANIDVQTKNNVCGKNETTKFDKLDLVLKC